MCSALDKLGEYERYEASLMPLLRQAVNEGWSTWKIRKVLASFSQALVIQQALCGNINRSSQISALRDVLDRYEGKACRKAGQTATAKISKAELIELIYCRLRAAKVVSSEK